MLFINISSDQVHLCDDQSEHFLPRNGIENVLWATLLEYTQTHPVETILLLNGPGGFTNLRVGTLVLNMLNTLLEYDTGTFIPIASLTKLALYTYAYKQWRLPRYGIIYVGQKRNVWKYDFQEQTYQQLLLDEINYTDDIFLDRVYDTYRSITDAIVSFSMKNNMLQLHYKEQKYPIELNKLNLTPTMTIKPEYLIDPTIN